MKCQNCQCIHCLRNHHRAFHPVGGGRFSGGHRVERQRRSAINRIAVHHRDVEVAHRLVRAAYDVLGLCPRDLVRLTVRHLRSFNDLLQVVREVPHEQ